MKTILTALIIGALCLTAGYGYARYSAEKATPKATPKADEQSVTRVEHDSVRAELDELRQRRDEELAKKVQLEAEKEKLQAELQAARDQVETLVKAAAPADATEEEIDQLLAIAFGDHSEMPELLNADWKTMAESIRAIQTDILALAKALETGEELDQETQIRIAKNNQALLSFALEVNGKLPTHAVNANGEFTHPLAQANLMTEVLAQGEEPLSARQQTLLSDLGQDYEDEWARLQGEYPEGTSALAKLMDEAELKQDFYDGFADNLTPGQQSALFPDATRGNAMLDLFSPGLMFRGTGQPLPFNSPDELKGQLLQRASSYLGLTEEDLAGHDHVFATWATEVGEGLTPVSGGTAMMYSTDEAIAAGHAQRRALEALMANLELSEEVRTRLLEQPNFLVPRLMAPEPSDGVAEESEEASAEEG